MIYFRQVADDMLRFTSLLALLVVIGLVTSSCSNKRPVYQGAEYYKNLEVPPNLTAPDKVDEVIIPKPTDEALDSFSDKNKLNTYLTPKFDGVRTVSYAGNSWIEVDNTADVVWPKLLDFWEGEGFTLTQVRPVLGFMETGWEERLDSGEDKNYLVKLLQRLDPDMKDKFRVRIERFENNTKTRLFVSNSRIERVVSGEYGDTFSWRSLPSSLPAEREIISRMARYAGLKRNDIVALLDNYRPYASLVKVDSSNTVALYMKGSMDFVWRRAMRALNRMRMDGIIQHKEDSRIDFVVGELSQDEINTEEDSLAKSSWIMNLFSTEPTRVEVSGDDRNYQLVFSADGDFIKIEVESVFESTTQDADGNIEGTALGEQVRNLLVKRLE